MRERQQRGDNIAGVVVSLSHDIWSIDDVCARERQQHKGMPQIVCFCHLSIVRASAMDHIGRVRHQRGDNITGVVVSFSRDVWSIADVRAKKRQQHKAMPQILCFCHLSIVCASAMDHIARERQQQGNDIAGVVVSLSLMIYGPLLMCAIERDCRANGNNLYGQWSKYICIR